ncbi:hypothetical protein LguiA_031360 [Lonicera macranthoides]
MNTAATAYSSSSTYCAAPSSSPFLPMLRRRITSTATSTTTSINNTSSFFNAIFTPKPLSLSSNSPSRLVFAAAAARGTNSDPSKKNKKKEEVIIQEETEEVEEEEDLPWIQEKALDLVEFTGSVTHALPGPRVGQTSFPWVLALPLAYVGVSFVIAFVKTVRKFNSPKEKRRKLVNKNAALCKSIDDLFEKGSDGIQQSALKELMQKTDFGMEEILRKYIRYAFNEKPFNPELVSNLIQLRKASKLGDSQVAEILNDISRRIVKDKGPVVMDMSGYSEKGFKRKLAVQALFGKVYYLSELPEFCSKDSSLIVKEIFGVADEDAEKLRVHAVSEGGDLDSLKKMVDGGSDSEDSSGDSDSEDSSGGSSTSPLDSQ